MTRPTSGSMSPSEPPSEPPSASPSAAVRLLGTLPPGTRVSVRYALPEGDPSGLPLTDALGELTVVGPGTVTVRTRRGDVVVAVRDVRAARVVPPAAPRRRG